MDGFSIGDIVPLFLAPYSEFGSVTASVRRRNNGYLLDFADNTFKSSPATSSVTLAQQGNSWYYAWDTTALNEGGALTGKQNLVIEYTADGEVFTEDLNLGYGGGGGAGGATTAEISALLTSQITTLSTAQVAAITADMIEAIKPYSAIAMKRIEPITSAIAPEGALVWTLGHASATASFTVTLSAKYADGTLERDIVDAVYTTGTTSDSETWYVDASAFPDDCYLYCKITSGSDNTGGLTTDNQSYLTYTSASVGGIYKNLRIALPQGVSTGIEGFVDALTGEIRLSTGAIPGGGQSVAGWGTGKRAYDLSSATLANISGDTDNIYNQGVTNARYAIAASYMCVDGKNDWSSGSITFSGTHSAGVIYIYYGQVYNDKIDSYGDPQATITAGVYAADVAAVTSDAPATLFVFYYDENTVITEGDLVLSMSNTSTGATIDYTFKLPAYNGGAAQTGMIFDRLTGAAVDLDGSPFVSQGMATPVVDQCSGGGGGTGTGAITWPITITSSITTLPIAQVKVWITTDLAGANIIASGYTDNFGVVTFYLDSGTYYAWCQKGGWNFTNPTSQAVS